MVLSEKSQEDKQKLKSGFLAIVVLVACFTIGPIMMAEFTGVNTDTLCVTDDQEGITTEKCLDDEGYRGELKLGLKEALTFWLPLAVFLVGVLVFAWLGIKY